MHSESNANTTQERELDRHSNDIGTNARRYAV